MPDFLGAAGGAAEERATADPRIGPRPAAAPIPPRTVSVVVATHDLAIRTLLQPADLTLIDPQATWTVHGADFYSKGKITPFEGTTFQGRVHTTLVRGTVVYDAERGILVPPGHGQWLRRRDCKNR